MLNTTNTTLSDLINFAYDLHLNQITRVPRGSNRTSSISRENPTCRNSPIVAQLKMMVQKLLVDRFQLTFHNERKNSPVRDYRCKDRTQAHQERKSVATFPAVFRRGYARMTFIVRNSSITEFAIFCKANILDQPVVDQTGLTGTTST